MEKLIAICVQEEERLKGSHGDSINYVKQNKKSSYYNKNSKAQGKPQWDNSCISKAHGKAPQNDHHQKSYNEEVNKDTCRQCKKKGHYQKDCPNFLTHLMKKGEDVITFVDESLYLNYAKSTWWIDSGATIHVANSLQGFHTRRTLQRGERTIRVANGVEAEVEAIGVLPLELKDGFVLHLRDVLYVPSLCRNLISVSRLDSDGFACHFGDERCKIMFNKKCVGLAFQEDKLYLLSLNENVNVVSTDNVNASSSISVTNKRKRIDAASSKLWHCHLGHILRG